MMGNPSFIRSLCRHQPRRRRRTPGGPADSFWRHAASAVASAAASAVASASSTIDRPRAPSPSWSPGGDARRSSTRQSGRSHFSTEAEGDARVASPRGGGRPPGWKDDGLTLSHFIASSAESPSPDSSCKSDTDDSASSVPAAAELGDEFDEAFAEQDLMVTDAMSCSNKDETPSVLDRLGHQMINGNDGEEAFHTLKFHIKTYGCQMNVNDTDIVRSILLNNHTHQNGTLVDDTQSPTYRSTNTPLKFIETNDEIKADVLLTNTCAIRENAENKVWNRLRELRSHDRNYPLPSLRDHASSSDDLTELTKERRKQLQKRNSQHKRKRIVGVLGCMAERLKEDMFRDGTADLVVGPDAYRDLPRLISVLAAPSLAVSDGDTNNTPAIPTERAVNVQLSLDETYASVAPVRSNPDDVSAFVSVMRGCNNMCSYCVVPFTRGRERSRELESIVEETQRLLDEEGIREVILLGQNVNSYHDVSGEKKRRGKATREEGGNSSYQTSNDGFSNLFRLRHGDGHRFADLLEAVSSLSPELRVRFTSPHPKDYPPALLSLMAERPNICNHLHMPAQSGSSSVLHRMRRGYTREAYLELIDDVRRLIPDVAISSDFIAGFCGETEDEHRETVSLIDEVRFDQAFMFAYSMRGKTHAHRTMEDDVPPDVKGLRLNEIIDVFRRNVQLRNDEVEVGRLRLVLVEGEARRSTADNRAWSGRTDQNKRVVFADGALLTEEEVNPHLARLLTHGTSVDDEGAAPSLFEDFANDGNARVELSRGDYAVVHITEARGHTLKGQALCRSSIAGFDRLKNTRGWKGSSGGLARQVAMQ